MLEKRIRVLVVDDEPDVVEILSYNLLKENFEVLKAFDGMQAVSIALENHPDLVIMDIHMPRLSGIEACRMLKETSGTKDIPVLFLTGDSDDYVSLSAFVAGASQYITKPVRPGLLMHMVHKIIDKPGISKGELSSLYKTRSSGVGGVL